MRSLKLEEEIEQIRSMLDNSGPRKMAVVPMVTDFEVDSDCRLHAFIALTVDTLGVETGLGFVWICDKSGDAHAIKQRDQLADEILKDLHNQRKFDEVIEVETKRE